MFENLRRAFREAVDNFKEELGRDDVPEAVNRLLAGMRDEVTDAQAQVRKLEEDLAKARALVEEEERQLATCRRRETLARDIGDEETVRIALEYAERHERRLEAFRHKVVAFEEELTVRRAEVQEMLQALKKAQSNRDILAAQAGRTDAREAVSAADDLFAELDRMAEKMGSADDRTAAEREVDALFDEFGPDAEPPSPAPEMDVDARLEALKRAMGKDG
ncbi:MAG: hypothetical protein D6701_06025 [Gemmatimonadetes bacterium]|nr:MAG: hypothetical protein D6701_06025 [Gemmatimonadota bacterium]